MPVGCPLSDGEYSGMPSLFHALSGVRLIVAACFDVPLLSFLCITEITLYYNVLHTHFFIYPLFFLSFGVSFLQSIYVLHQITQYYIVLHHILHFQSQSYISACFDT